MGCSLVAGAALTSLKVYRAKPPLVENTQERPHLLADVHHMIPDGVKWCELPGIEAGCIKLDSHTPLEEAASLTREQGVPYVVTCNGGGREFGYIHADTLFDMVDKLPEVRGESTLPSDMSVWRARRRGVPIPKGRWQTVGGWICDVTGWGVLQEGDVTYENWRIKVLKSENKRHTVVLERRERA